MAASVRFAFVVAALSFYSVVEAYRLEDLPDCHIVNAALSKPACNISTDLWVHGDSSEIFPRLCLLRCLDEIEIAMPLMLIDSTPGCIIMRPNVNYFFDQCRINFGDPPQRYKPFVNVTAVQGCEPFLRIFQRDCGFKFSNSSDATYIQTTMCSRFCRPILETALESFAPGGSEGHCREIGQSVARMQSECYLWEGEQSGGMLGCVAGVSLLTSPMCRVKSADLWQVTRSGFQSTVFCKESCWNAFHVQRDTLLAAGGACAQLSVAVTKAKQRCEFSENRLQSNCTAFNTVLTSCGVRNVTDLLHYSDQTSWAIACSLQCLAKIQTFIDLMKVDRSTAVQGNPDCRLLVELITLDLNLGRARPCWQAGQRRALCPVLSETLKSSCGIVMTQFGSTVNDYSVAPEYTDYTDVLSFSPLSSQFDSYDYYQPGDDNFLRLQLDNFCAPRCAAAYQSTITSNRLAESGDYGCQFMLQEQTWLSSLCVKREQAYQNRTCSATYFPWEACGVTSDVDMHFLYRFLCQPRCVQAVKKALVALALPEAGFYCNDIATNFDKHLLNCQAGPASKDSDYMGGIYVCPTTGRFRFCLQNPCLNAVCSKNPSAICTPDYCNGCRAVFRDAAGNVVEDCDARGLCGSGNKCKDTQYCCNLEKRLCADDLLVCAPPELSATTCPRGRSKLSNGMVQCSDAGACIVDQICDCFSGNYGEACQYSRDQVITKSEQLLTEVQLATLNYENIVQQTAKCVAPARPILCPDHPYTRPWLVENCVATMAHCVHVPDMDLNRLRCEATPGATFCGTSCAPPSLSCSDMTPPLKACPRGRNVVPTARCPLGNCVLQLSDCANVTNAANLCAGQDVEGDHPCGDGLHCFKTPSLCSRFVGWNGCGVGLYECPGRKRVCVPDPSLCASAVGCRDGLVACSPRRVAGNAAPVFQNGVGDFLARPTCKLKCQLKASDYDPRPSQIFIDPTFPRTLRIKAQGSERVIMLIKPSRDSILNVLNPVVAVNFFLSDVPDSAKSFGSFGHFERVGCVVSPIISLAPSTVYQVRRGFFLDIVVDSDTDGGVVDAQGCELLLTSFAAYSTNDIHDIAGAERIATCKRGEMEDCSCLFEVRHFSSFAVIDETTYVNILNFQVKDLVVVDTPLPPLLACACNLHPAVWAAFFWAMCALCVRG